MWEQYRGKIFFFLLLVSCFLATARPAQAEIQADCEVEEGPVAGLVAIRGRAFDTEEGVLISRVSLFIDGVLIGEIPCCSERADIAAAFPQFPAENTLNSGWGTIFNWGVLAEGEHTLYVEIQNTEGALFTTLPKTITVIKPGGFEYLSAVSLAGATADIDNDELVLTGVVVEGEADGATQQQEVNLQYAWSSSAQQLALVSAETVENVASASQSFWLDWPSWSDWWPAWSTLIHRVARVFSGYTAYAAPGLYALFEHPIDGQIGAGITILRGWGLGADGKAIKEIRLLIDGKQAGIIPCCSERADVAAAYPDIFIALFSGWGTTLNYWTLAPGEHIFRVEIEGADGSECVFEHTVTVVKIGDFEFIDDLDLSGATIQIDVDEIILENVVVLSGESQQLVHLRFRWDSGMQTLILIHAENVGPEGAADTEPDPDPEDTTPIPTDAPPTLTVTPATIDMDMVAIGETGEKLLRVENTGGGILIVNLVLSGDASFSLSPLGTVNLGAGHTRWITIQFSPTAEGAASASLALTSSVGDVEVGLTGSGFEPALNASTSAIDFGQVETGASATVTFQLTNPGTETVSSVAVSTPASPFTVDVPDVSGGIGAGVSIDILVGFEPATVGTFTTEIVITWQDGQSTTIRLDGEGITPPLALELSVLEVDFGDVAILDVGMETVTLTNPNSGTILSISVSDPGAPFVSSQPGVTELGSGESVDFSVGFEPTSIGPVQVDVVINWGSGLFTTVTLKGNGVAAP